MLTFEHLTIDFTGHGASRRYGEVPETCPHCHHHVDPRRLTACDTVLGGTRVDFAFQCPRPECRRVFVGRYELGLDGELDLASVAPAQARRESVPAEVEALSPAFVEVFGQAQDADSRGHTHLAALGYRGALDLLVRDYAVREHPELAAEIRGLSLAGCIARFADNPRVKAAAARTPALAPGCDDHEAVAELKVLLRLTVNWLDNVLLERTYLAPA